MRLVLDLQGSQSASRYRGIGRQSLSFARAVAALAKERNHEVWVVLNDLFPDSVEPIRQELATVVPAERVTVFSVPGPVAEVQVGNDARVRAAELVREQAILQLRPDLVHVCSLFEGFADDAVTSVGRLSTDVPTAVTLHDLIPLLLPERYLAEPSYRRHYHRKLESLRRADLLLAISESVAADARTLLGFPAERVVHVSSNVDSRFHPAPISRTHGRTLELLYGCERPFVLFAPGGFDPRKNFERLVEAYARLDRSIRDAHCLVIASRVSPADRERVLSLARSVGLGRGELVLTGYVPDEDLIDLYRMAKLFVMPSLREGFGLPALEAMACGTPCIASGTSSLPEVIGREDALFDPESVESMANAMHRCLTDEAFLSDLKAHALVQASKFSWDRTARTALEAFEELVRGREAARSGQAAGAAPARSYVDGSYSSLLAALAKDTVCHGVLADEHERRTLAQCIAANQAPVGLKQLLVDISELVHRDAKTGIQRVVRSISDRLLVAPPEGFRVELVYRDREQGVYRYARRFRSTFAASGDDSAVVDDVIDMRRGDVFVGLDLDLLGADAIGSFLERGRRRGMAVYVVVYDLLIHLRPDCFPQGTEPAWNHWFETISARTDGLVAISRAVADEILTWLDEHRPARARSLGVGYFHLGADIQSSRPTSGSSAGEESVLAAVSDRPTLLMVGTVEPRKGYAQALAAMEQVWKSGRDVNLVIVGKPGWNVERLVANLEGHPERGKRLHWLSGATDETLLRLYEGSSGLLAASEGEGFGLPLIEAAQHGLPILARGLPVFREVAGDHAYYFDGKGASDLAARILSWLDLLASSSVPPSTGITHLSWAESAEALLDVVIRGGWYRQWSSTVT